MLTQRDIEEIGIHSSPWSQTRVSKCDADPAYEKKFLYSEFLNASEEQLAAYERYRKMIRRCENELVGRASGINLIRVYEQHYNVSGKPKGK